jgi:pyruvate dehydrogenase E2 component (dihydrolipoamide acetyltransferase)
MEEGKLAKWLVKEGDTVKSGDILAEIETDKATMEFEAVDEGVIGKLLVPEGTEGVKVNAPIAILLGEGEATGVADIPATMTLIKEAVAEVAKPKAVAQVMSAPAPIKAPAAVPAPTSPSPPTRLASPKAMPDDARPANAPPEHSLTASTLKGGGEKRLFASPLARRLANQKGIDIAALTGSGPRGRIVKSDVESAKPGAAQVGKAPQAGERAETSVVHSEGPALLPDARLFYKPDDYVEIPHDLMRKSIAKRLSSAAASIPHFYLTIDCNIDSLLATRARLNEASPAGEGAYKLSVTDFIVKAAALALQHVPEVNASWTDTAILRHKHADVGVAVALDFGLITPIVFHAEEKGLAVISNEVKSLAERARAKKLKPQEYEGGGFAISNLGMFGIKNFTAIINPPHAGILAVGAGERRAVVVGGKVEIATVMTVTMSCDHRVIDGATGARFLQVFKQYIEEPAAMLL